MSHLGAPSELVAVTNASDTTFVSFLPLVFIYMCCAKPARHLRDNSLPLEVERESPATAQRQRARAEDIRSTEASGAVVSLAGEDMPQTDEGISERQINTRPYDMQRDKNFLYIRHRGDARSLPEMTAPLTTHTALFEFTSRVAF